MARRAGIQHAPSITSISSSEIAATLACCPALDSCQISPHQAIEPNRRGKSHQDSGCRQHHPLLDHHALTDRLFPPSAMRMPSSRVRCATDCAITAYSPTPAAAAPCKLNAPIQVAAMRCCHNESAECWAPVCGRVMAMCLSVAATARWILAIPACFRMRCEPPRARVHHTPARSEHTRSSGASLVSARCRDVAGHADHFKGRPPRSFPAWIGDPLADRVFAWPHFFGEPAADDHYAGRADRRDR